MEKYYYRRPAIMQGIIIGKNIIKRNENGRYKPGLWVCYTEGTVRFSDQASYYYQEYEGELTFSLIIEALFSNNKIINSVCDKITRDYIKTLLIEVSQCI